MDFTMLRLVVILIIVVQLAKSAQLPPINHKLNISEELQIPVKVVQSDDKLDLGVTERKDQQQQQQQNHNNTTTTSRSPMIVEAISSNAYPLEQDHSWKLSKTYVVSDERSNNVNKPINRRDSYLDALELSQGKKSTTTDEPKSSKLFRRDYKQQGPVFRPESESSPIYGVPNKFESVKSPRIISSYSQSPSDSYSLPVQTSVSFINNGLQHQQHKQVPYPPQTSYGSPAAPLPQIQVNHVPSKSYGPPPPPAYHSPPKQGETEGRAYGPPPTIAYSIPTQEISILPTLDLTWPFALKLNVFTIGKILLKLVIFKMIVKFIAVICLLMFLPKLEHIKGDKEDDEEEDDEGRSFFDKTSARERLNLLTRMVTASIEKYEEINRSLDPCDSFSCRVQRALTAGESWRDYAKLFKSYVQEETKD